ncbi:MAG: hypothetical protein KGJ79_15240 [Alphaproteobacteria bacterium]|nr:hypothetical protein [Alphaproteobacteria bacterium]MDE2112495.1 hypothetical protein [Alphaproteobacteria bacterium]MDE2494219.1 hypothetical protein [Alphaproteobacteria bacterium]
MKNPEQHKAADPAQAFEDLRAEVSVLRKAVETLPAVLRDNRPPDYAQDLAVIGKGLDDIGAQLETLQKYPSLRMTPEQQGQSIASAGSALIREAVQKFDRATQDADRERNNLANMIGTLRGKQDQRNWLMIVGAIAFVIGFAAFPFMIRAMPFGVNSEIAAAIMEADQWDAGIALMKSGNPAGWEQLVADANLVSANQDKIVACQNTAAKTKKEERCIITVQVDGS